MLGLATPFGKYVGVGIGNIAKAYKEASNADAIDKNVDTMRDEWHGYFGNVVLPAKGKTLEEYTWAEVQQIIQAGKVTEYGFKVGDLTRTFTINNNAGKQARIVDINGNKVTFMLTSSIGTHEMNTATVEYEWGNNFGGYVDSEMKVWLDETVYNSLDADLKAVISPATITCADGYNSPNGTKTAEGCYLFLPSIKEVGLNDDISSWYSYMTAIEAEGETFDYFAEGGYIDVWFWLRSPNSGRENYFFIYYYGNDYYNSAYVSGPVYPAFVIG